MRGYGNTAAPNSPSYFAFKMFRNPDGQNTAFGDRYLPIKASAPADVSVHAARDSKTGRLTFVLINKRVAKDARVTLKLSKRVPEQEVVFYEYSGADRFAIGQLPPRKLVGDALDVHAVPPAGDPNLSDLCVLWRQLCIGITYDR